MTAVVGCLLCCGAGGNRTLVRRAVPTALRPFPRSRRYGCRTAGSEGPRGLTAGSFPDVSGLSRRQRSLPPSSTASVAGLQWTGPVCHCWSRCLSDYLVDRRRERSRHRRSFGAPFNESEQLGSHESAPGLNVETDQPRVVTMSRIAPVARGRARLPAATRSRPVSRSARRIARRDVRSASRSAMAWRLSWVLAAPAEGELDLGPAVLEVERQRHERQVLLVDAGAQPLDLVAVQEQLALARRVVAGVGLGVRVRRDVQPDAARSRRRRCGRRRRRAAPWPRGATSPRCPAARCPPRTCRGSRSRGAPAVGGDDLGAGRSRMGSPRLPVRRSTLPSPPCCA